MERVERSLIATSWLAKPTELKTRVLLAGAEIENLPSLSVCVAVLVFFTKTVTPDKAESPETTLPVIAFWAKTVEQQNNRKTKRRECTFFDLGVQLLIGGENSFPRGMQFNIDNRLVWLTKKLYEFKHSLTNLIFFFIITNTF